jgi:hypothetical protein
LADPAGYYRLLANITESEIAAETRCPLQERIAFCFPDCCTVNAISSAMTPIKAKKAIRCIVEFLSFPDSLATADQSGINNHLPFLPDPAKEPGYQEIFLKNHRPRSLRNLRS